MKVKNFMKKFSAFALGLGLTIGVVSGANVKGHEVDAGTEKTVELCVSTGGQIAYADDKTFTVQAPNFSGGNTEITIAYKGVYKQGAANTYFQMNKKDGYFKNTVAMPGKITKIETAWSAAKNPTTIYFGKTASTVTTKVTVSTGTSVNYAPSSDDTNDYYFFNLDVKTGSGSAQMTKCIVHYEEVKASGCEHSWGTGSVTTPATCQAPGVKTFTCSKCSETKTEEIPQLDHNYSYVSNGVSGHTKTCSVGHENETEAHVFGAVSNGQHSCTLCGYSEAYTVPSYEKVTSLTDLPANFIIVDETTGKAFNGNDEGNGVIDVTANNNIITGATGAAVVEIDEMVGGYSLKIVEGGNNTQKYISGTSNSNKLNFNDTASVNTIEFNGDGKATIVSATSTFIYNGASGTSNNRFRYYKSGTTIGDTYHLPSLFRYVEPGCKHTDKTDYPALAATCEADGNEAYSICNDCSAILDANGNVIDAVPVLTAIGHNMNSGVVTTEPTCTTAGEKLFSCQRSGCSHTTTEVIPALGHDWGDYSVITEPTCTEPGHGAAKCKRCGEESSSAEIPALGHDWDDGVETTAPTCTEDGVMTYTCERAGCGATKTEPIAKLGHDWGEWTQTTAPTCTAAGVETRTCKRGGCTASETRPVSATGHSFGEWVTTTDATCTEAGEQTRYCQHGGCTETETQPVAALGHDFVDGVCSRCGAEQPKVFTLAESTDVLVENAKVIFIYKDGETTYGMPAHTAGNNIKGVTITPEDDGTFDPTKLGTVEGYTVNYVENKGYTFKDSQGRYIYAAGGTGKNNYLKPTTNVNDPIYWTITFTDNGPAIVCADTSVARNTIMWNNNSDQKLFSCYASGQQQISIYVCPPASAAKATIAYVGNGAKGAIPTDLTEYDAGTEITTLPGVGSMTMVGHTFRGWSLSENGEVVTSVTLEKGINTLYAIWENTTVTHAGTEADPYTPDEAYSLMLDGHEGVVYVQGVVDSVSGSNFYCEVSFEGCKFEGYKLAIPSGETVGVGDTVLMSGTIVSYNGIAEISGDTGKDGQIISITHPAVPHSITYHVEGGTAPVDSAQYYNGDEITVTSSVPTKENYAFRGWALTTNGTGKLYTAGEKISVANDDIHLYAAWVEDDNLEHNFFERSDTGITGSQYTTWTKSVSEISYAGKSAGSNESIQLNTGDSGIVNTTSIGVAKKVRVIFADATGSSNGIEVFGKNTPYGTASDLNGDQKGTSLGTILKSNESKELVIDGNYQYIGIKAKNGAAYCLQIEIVWQETSVYTVSYDVEGITDAKVYLPGQEVTVTESEPAAREHYEFLGWSIDGENVVTSFNISANTELKALWKAEEGYTENIVVDDKGNADVNGCTITGIAKDCTIASGETLLITAPEGKAIDVRKLAVELEGDPTVTIMVSNGSERWEYKPTKQTKSLKPVVEHDLDSVTSVEITVGADTKLNGIKLITHDAAFNTYGQFSVDYEYYYIDGVVSEVEATSALIRFATKVDESRLSQEGYKFGYVIATSLELQDAGATSIKDLYNTFFDADDEDVDSLMEIVDAMLPGTKHTSKDNVSALTATADGKEYGVKLNVLGNLETEYHVVFYVVDANGQIVEFGNEFMGSLRDIVVEDYYGGLTAGSVEHEVLRQLFNII